jgi:TIR domain
VPKVFISYRSTDLALAKKLSAELKECGNDVWLDDEEILAGDSIVERVQAGLTGSKYVVLCLSSDGPSKWTDLEWMSTLARQLSGIDIKLLPVFLSGGSLPAILADIAYVDLTHNWNHGLNRLCQAIK